MAKKCCCSTTTMTHAKNIEKLSTYGKKLDKLKIVSKLFKK